MESTKKLEVTCLQCKNSDKIVTYEDRLIDWGASTCTYIVSGRKRLDGNWGWQCACGNNDIMTQQEIEHITNKQDPDPKEIQDILKDIKPDKPRFSY